MVGVLPRVVQLVDLNGDGAIDIVTANAGSSDITLLMGDGCGGFASQVRLSIGTGGGAPRDLSAGDLNEDGVLDIVVGNGLDRTVSLLLSGAQGTGLEADADAGAP